MMNEEKAEAFVRKHWPAHPRATRDINTPPKHPLPWTNEPDIGSSKGIIRDANGELILIYGRNGEELRARIVTAVNSNPDLIAAAKGVLHIAFSRELLADDARLCIALEAAVERAEQAQ